MRSRFLALLALSLLAACGDGGKEFDEHLAAGQKLLEQGKYDAALPELQQAVEQNKDSIDARVALGRVSMMPYRQSDGTVGISKASLERAEMNLESAIQGAPDNIEAQRELALAYEKLGKQADAVKSWTAVRDLAAKDAAHAQIAAEANAALERLK